MVSFFTSFNHHMCLYFVILHFTIFFKSTEFSPIFGRPSVARFREFSTLHSLLKSTELSPFFCRPFVSLFHVFLTPSFTVKSTELALIWRPALSFFHEFSTFPFLFESTELSPIFCRPSVPFSPS